MYYLFYEYVVSDDDPLITSSCHSGMKSAPSRTRLKMSASCGLRKVSSWMDSICPIFKAAPRTRHSVETRRVALASDRKTEESEPGRHWSVTRGEETLESQSCRTCTDEASRSLCGRAETKADT